MQATTHTTIIALMFALGLGQANAQDEGRDFIQLFDKTSGGGGRLILVEPGQLAKAPDRAALERTLARSGQTRREVGLAFLNWLNKKSNEAPGKRSNTPQQTLDPDEILEKDPVTMVIFPGIFGEFIATRAMEEIFEDQTSSFACEWRTALRTNIDDPVMGQAFSLHSLEETAVPFEELVSAASIDDENGQALVNVILIRTPPLSMESAGTISDLAAVYGRRLNRFFDVLGRIPGTIGFAGYSMGTTTALQVLCDSSGAPWAANVRGMISLAGVNFGSTAADVSFTTPAGKQPVASFTQLALLKTLAAELELPNLEWFWQRSAARSRNLERWAKFASDILPTMKKPGDGPQPDFELIRMDRARSMLEAAILTFVTNFNISLSDEAHLMNVRRWKKFVSRILAGTAELTTEARLDWWATHTVPTHVKYYAITASLTGKETAPRNGEATGVMLGSIDYSTNLGGYNDYISAGGSTLNDGQVGVHQARFWPQLATFLNPQQGAFEAEFLGTFRTHHWGLALRTGMGGTNPFPRAALLKALAAKIARDVQQSEEDEADVVADDNSAAGAVGSMKRNER